MTINPERPTVPPESEVFRAPPKMGNTSFDFFSSWREPQFNTKKTDKGKQPPPVHCRLHSKNSGTCGTSGTVHENANHDNQLQCPTQSENEFYLVGQGGTIQSCHGGVEHAVSQLEAVFSGWPDYEELVAALIHDHGVDETTARHNALESLIAWWLHRHPPSGPGVGRTARECAGCGHLLGTIGPGGVALADGAWVHPECQEGWRKQRRREAIKALMQEART